ncbi:MAG: hypothetical protein Kow0092_19650 [Deferrisomatales bacterium]
MNRTVGGVLLTVSAVGALWLLLQGLPGPVPTPTQAPDREPASEFRGVELVEQEADGTVWRLTAEEGQAWETETSGVLKQVRLEFQRRARRVELEAGEARVERGEEIRLSGGVRIAWAGYTARMDRATYLRERGEIRSDGPVELAGPAMTVRGKGLEVDVEGRVARILARVRTVVGERQR